MTIEKSSNSSRDRAEPAESKRDRKTACSGESGAQSERSQRSFRDAMKRASGQREERGADRQSNARRHSDRCGERRVDRETGGRRKRERSDVRRREGRRLRGDRDGEGASADRVDRRRHRQSKDRAGEETRHGGGQMGQMTSERAPQPRASVEAASGADRSDRAAASSDRTAATGRGELAEQHIQRLADDMVKAVRVGRDEQRRRVVMMDVEVPGRGELRIRMRRDGESYDVAFRTDDRDLRQDVSRGTNALRRAVDERGVRLGSVRVASNETRGESE